MTPSADSSKKIKTAIDKINEGLNAKIMGINLIASNQAVDAWVRFNSALIRYNFQFLEIVDSDVNNIHAKGGLSSDRTSGMVLWDPNYTLRSQVRGSGFNEKLLISAPYLILAHEIWHAIDSLEYSYSYNASMARLDAGRYSNYRELSAIMFENLVRSNGDQRTFHDPSKGGKF